MPRARLTGTSKSTQAGGTASSSGKSSILKQTEFTWSKQRAIISTLQSASQQTDPPCMLQTRSKQSGTPSTGQPRDGKHELLGLFSALAVKDAAQDMSAKTGSEQPGCLPTARSDSSAQKNPKLRKSSEGADSVMWQRDMSQSYEDVGKEFEHVGSDEEGISDDEEESRGPSHR